MKELEMFRNMFYGDYVCSGSGKILKGLCYCVGEVDDEEGYNWRSFCEEFWKEHIENKMSLDEVYAKFEVSEAC